VNNQTTLIQGIDISRLQTALNNLSFAVSTQNLSPVTSVTGALPTGVGSTNAQQTISFNRLANGDSATVGGLTFTANTDLTGTQVATIFAQKINSSSNSASGIFTNGFQGGYAVADNNSGILTFTATSPGPNSIPVSGNLSSAATPLISGDVSIQQPGVIPVTGVSPQQTVTLRGLNAGDTAIIGGLTFTAASDLSASQVAAIFANKTAASSPTDPSASLGSFTGSLSGFNGSNVGGSAVLSLTGTSQVPTSAVTVGGTVTNRIAPTSATVATGASPSAGSVSNQNVQFQRMATNTTATVGGITFTASQDISATQVAQIFTSIATTGSNPYGMGTFTGGALSGHTITNNGSGVVNFTSTTVGPNLLSVTGNVSPSLVNALITSNVSIQQNGSLSTGEVDQVTFIDLLPNQTITIGGLTYTAGPSGDTAANVAAAFSVLSVGASAATAGDFVNRITETPTGTFSGGPFAYNSSNSLHSTNVTFTSTTLGSGHQVINTGTGSVSVTVLNQGLNGVLAQQTVNFQGLNAGDTAIIGGLTFTAASDLSASQVAAIFANKTAASSPTDPSASLGSFTGSLSGFNGSNVGGSAVLSLTGTSQVPTSAVTVGGTVTNRIAPTSATVATGASPSAGSVSNQNVQFQRMATNTTATVGGVTFTASLDLLATDVATIFTSLLTNGTNPISGSGTFTGTVPLTGYTVTNSGSGVVNVTSTSVGPNLLAVNGNVSSSLVTPIGSGSVSIQQTGVTPVTGNPSNQNVQFQRMATNTTATVGGVTFTASLDLLATDVATIFTSLLTNGTNPISGSGTFTGTVPLTGYTVTNSGSGVVNVTSTSVGPNLLAVNGNVSSSLVTPIGSGSVSIQQTGVTPVTGVSPQQSVTMHALNIGDTAIIGGLTFTAASDLSASQVAAIFANKTAASSPTDPSASLGSFTGSLSGFNGSNVGGSAVLSLTGTSQVPTSAVTVGGNVISRVALSPSNVAIIAPGSSGTPGVYAQQTVNLSDLDAGNSATIGGLTLTAKANLTAAELATIFANRIANGRDVDSSLGTFSGTFIGGFTGASAGKTLTLTGTSFGPMATITASEMVSGAANAPKAIALINQFISQISSTQASLSAASTDLNSALDKSTKLVTSSQKTVDAIQNIDLTALQASLQALSTQQSLDFQVVAQMNTASASILSIFR
jgi:hypothetical protein